jgi:hypothetical protein
VNIKILLIWNNAQKKKKMNGCLLKPTTQPFQKTIAHLSEPGLVILPEIICSFNFNKNTKGDKKSKNKDKLASYTSRLPAIA